MRVLVTGASGYIGRALAGALAARGDEVVTVTHRPPLPGQVGVNLGERRLDTSRMPAGRLGEVDTAVHLAGTPIVARWTSRRREEIRASRIALGDILARALVSLEPPPGVHVTGSAIGYYGERGEEELDEGSPPGNGFLAEVCRAWEDAATPAREAGIRVVALRTGVVLGQCGGALGPQLPIFRLGLGGRLGAGRQWTSWVSLADEVRMILFALDTASVSGPINATSPNPVRNAELAAALGGALHKSAPFAVPPLVLELALGRGPAREMLLVSQRVRPARLEQAGFRFEHPDVERAIAAALGRPTLPS